MLTKKITQYYPTYIIKYVPDYDSSDTKHINKKMMENRHCDDVTERIFKLDILFSLEVMLGQKVKIMKLNKVIESTA